MTDTTSAPLLALSMEDYESKLSLLEDMPLKQARRYIEPLKYQALVGAVLGAFERYPAIEAIQFQDDGTRDSNVNGYEIIADVPGAEDIPTQHNGAWDDMNIPDLDKLLWWFFDDEDFRAELSHARFDREEAVDQLETMLKQQITLWDVSWREFVHSVYGHMGRPEALAEQAEASRLVSDDPTIVALFAKLRSATGLNKALDAAPDDAWMARKQAKGLNGENEAWSPLAQGLMYLLNHPDDRANQDLWRLITFTTSTPDSDDAKRFLKLAGPNNNLDLWAPEWIDPFALMWIITGRCSMAINGHQRQKWSDALLAWSDTSAAWGDYLAMQQCLVLALHAKDTSLFTGHAYHRCKTMLDRIWAVWFDARTPAEEKPFIDNFDMMSDTLLYYGGRARLMPSWVPGKGIEGFAIGPGAKLSMANRLEDAPVDLALRMGLTTLASETKSDEIAAAEAFLMGLLDKGAGLAKDDPHLEKRLAGKGVSDALRARIRAGLKDSEPDEQDGEEVSQSD